MKGHCLCGGIEVSAGDHQEVGLCHCSTCRRWSGGPLFAVHCGKEVRFRGLTPVAYRSSEWAERGFCPTCGTHLFYHLLPTDEYIVPAGLFQSEPDLHRRKAGFLRAEKRDTDPDRSAGFRAVCAQAVRTGSAIIGRNQRNRQCNWW